MKKEAEIEHELIESLVGLKYSYRNDIRDRETLERNFRQKFEALTRIIHDTCMIGRETMFCARVR